MSSPSGTQSSCVLHQEGEVLLCEGGLANLVHVIKNGMIRMDEKKVQAIREWEPPTKVSE